MNQLILKTNLLTMAFFLATFGLQAQMSLTEMPIDTIKIEEIVVTGTPVKVNRNNVPMAVSVVTKTQIDASEESALLDKPVEAPAISPEPLRANDTPEEAHISNAVPISDDFDSTFLSAEDAAAVAATIDLEQQHRDVVGSARLVGLVHSDY